MFKYEVTDLPTSFSYRGKRSALFCCRGRIEIKYSFLWLLQNYLHGVDMFEIKKPYAEAFVFETTFRHRGGYSATTPITRALFLNYFKLEAKQRTERF